MNKSFSGSPKCTEENLDYFTEKLREMIQNKEKMTFRKWLNKMMNLMDLID